MSFHVIREQALYEFHFCFMLFLEVGSYYVAQAGFELLGGSNSPASTSQVAEFIGTYHHAQLIFCIFSRDGVSPC